MMDPLLNIPAPPLAKPLSPGAAGPGRQPGGEFAAVFQEAVGRVENFRAEAEQAVQRFLSGEQEEVHSVAMATQRAELAFELFLQVKNKAVQAYQEVMRMQL